MIKYLITFIFFALKSYGALEVTIAQGKVEPTPIAITQVFGDDADTSRYGNTIRQIIADANVQDFEELYRYLYDHAHIFALGKEGMVAYHINEYSYQSNFRIDKEINCMALINQLINV